MVDILSAPPSQQAVRHPSGPERAPLRIVTFERPEPRDTPSSQSALGAAALGFEALEGVRHGAERIGAIVPEGPLAGATIDLNRALAVQLAIDDAGAPEAQADSLLPAETARFMQRWPSAIEAARATLSFVTRAANTYDAPDWEAAGVVVPAAAARKRAPIPRPTNILLADGECAPFRVLPLSCSSLARDGDQTELPPELVVCATSALALVISRPTHRIRAARAAEHIAGYCAALDFVATSLRGERLDASLGRSCDNFTVLGPCLVTTDEVPNPHDALVGTRCSGEWVESSRSKRDTGAGGELLAQVSELITLMPGDLLLLPIAGHQTRTLRDGDLLEVDIEGLGRVVRYVRSRID